MHINSKYPFCWKYEYVPSYYEGLSESQEKIQTTVKSFKDGNFNKEEALWFVKNIQSLVGYDSSLWTVCFIPCRNEELQKNRFKDLADYIRKETNVETHLNCFVFVNEHTPIHQGENGKVRLSDIGLDVDKIFTKNVILIDDVITTGNTFNKTAKQAERAGANRIYGLFFAKTVHPDLPINEKKRRKKSEIETVIENEAEIMNKLCNSDY